jgi:hypothetical protein
MRRINLFAERQGACNQVPHSNRCAIKATGLFTMAQSSHSCVD